MRILLRIAFFLAGILVLIPVVGFCWLYLYPRDLPDIGTLATFSPTTITKVDDLCWKQQSVAIPYDSIGNNLRNALSAVEVREDDPRILTAIYRSFTGRALHRATLSLQISRALFCSPSRTLARTMLELRAAAELERRFSRRELFTIYANRVYFGQDLNGVEGAARSFFRNEPADLNVGDAALLAAVIKSPSLYSPVNHRDRALLRRNEVIDAMVASGTIKASEGEIAKTAPLDLAADPNRTN